MDALSNIKIDEGLRPDPPRKTWRFPLRLGKGLMGRILFGCLCSAIVGVVTNLPYLKAIILWICRIILFVFGNPEAPATIEHKLDQVVAKGRTIAARHESNREESKGSRPGPLHAIKEKLEAGIERRVEEKVGGAVAVAMVKEKVENAGAPSSRRPARSATRSTAWPMASKARSACARRRSRHTRRSWRSSKRNRSGRISSAAPSSTTFRGRTGPLRRWRDEVTAVEAKHAPNAQCPYCHHPLKIGRNQKERYRCPRCQGIYSARTAPLWGRRPTGGRSGIHS